MARRSTDELIIAAHGFKCKISRAETCSYDSDDLIDINEYVKSLCADIYLDKSYVRYDGNCHMDAYIRPEGWKMLTRLIKESGYGAKETHQQRKLINHLIGTLLLGYVVTALETVYDIDTGQISIDADLGTNYTVDYYADTIREWKLFDQAIAKLGK